MIKYLKVRVNGTVYDVQVEEIVGNIETQSVSPVFTESSDNTVISTETSKVEPAPVLEGIVITAPMPGTIVSADVTAGQAVKKGDILVVLEAMKMENEILSPKDARVLAIHVKKGDSINSGDALVSLG